MKPIPNPEPDKTVRPAHAVSHRTTATPKPATEQPSSEKTTPPRPVPPADHAKAVKLRAQGLEQLDRGRINTAVRMLEAANRLDPDNPLIQHDLDRALRISKAVQSRP